MLYNIITLYCSQPFLSYEPILYTYLMDLSIPPNPLSPLIPLIPLTPLNPPLIHRLHNANSRNFSRVFKTCASKCTNEAVKVRSSIVSLLHIPCCYVYHWNSVLNLRGRGSTNRSYPFSSILPTPPSKFYPRDVT